MSLIVRPVESYRDLETFIHLPFQIYSHDSPWVPPLTMEMKKRLNPEKNPYFDHAAVELFLAFNHGHPVGRIAAHYNELHSWYSHESVGFFGFFESIDDPAVAEALFRAAEQWLTKFRVPILRGPMNFSTNEECGLLVEGFDSPPAIMMPYNPPYYAPVLEQLGFHKVMDLWAWEVRYDTMNYDPFHKLAQVALKRAGTHLTVKTLELNRLEEEADRLRYIYNDAWAHNWGFIPMTRRQFTAMARDLKAIADPDFVLVAEWDDEPVGFLICLPDINILIKNIQGRLLPFGWWKLLRGLRKLRRGRVITLGVKHHLRLHGIDVILINEFIQRALRKGYTEVELSWILENNHTMNRPLEKLNAQRNKIYRIYERPIS